MTPYKGEQVGVIHIFTQQSVQRGAGAGRLNPGGGQPLLRLDVFMYGAEKTGYRLTPQQGDSEWAGPLNQPPKLRFMHEK